MNRSVSIGRILGIRLILHPSWFVIFALVVLSLATVRLPEEGPLSPGARWVVAIAVALCFFASVVAHELAHALTARRRGVEVNEITLFIFGGAAKLEQESPDPRTEALVAAVGPAASVLVGLLFFGVWAIFRNSASETVAILAESARWLGSINVALAVFNLIPGFPMDGGRLLRAILWRASGDFVKATRIATLVGRAFAYVLIAFGFLLALQRDVVSGLWLAFIGWFLNQAAEASYRRVAVEKLVEGISVRDVMDRDVAVVNPNLTLDTLVEQHLLTGQASLYPVAMDGNLVGTVELEQVRRVPNQERATTRVTDVMSRGDRLVTLRDTEPLWEAVSHFEETGASAIPVVDREDARRLVGIITRDGVFRALRARAQLGP